MWKSASGSSQMSENSPRYKRLYFKRTPNDIDQTVPKDLEVSIRGHFLWFRIIRIESERMRPHEFPSIM